MLICFANLFCEFEKGRKTVVVVGGGIHIS